MEMATEKPGFRRRAWVIHLAVTGFQALSSLYLITTPDDRNLGIIAAGFAILGLYLSISAFRNTKKYAWSAMWIFPITFTAVAVSIFISGEVGIAAYYLGLGAAGLLAQIASAPLFR